MNTILRRSFGAVFAVIMLFAGVNPEIVSASNNIAGSVKNNAGIVYEQDYDDPQKYRASGEISDDFYSDVLQIKKIDANANAYTGSVYTHHSQFDSYGIVNGIDVSQYQKDINWQKVKAAGIEYAFIRVGYRGYGSAGTLGEDPYYVKNMEGAIAAGIKVGVYIFSQAISVAEAEEEAQYILDRLGTYKISMPLVLDYEYAATGLGRLYNAKLSKNYATEVCMAFCNKIAKAGYTPMVYANTSMLNNQLNAATIRASYPIWLANYTTCATYTGVYDFWQYSSKGTVPGISGDVDMNFWYTNNKELYSASLQANNVTDMVYTGQPVVPEFSVSLGDVTLVPGTDYNYTIANNVDVGTATISIVGCGIYEGMTLDVNYNIIMPSVSNFRQSSATKKSITLSWDANPYVKGYEIYRATALDGEYKKIKTISDAATTTYKNNNLTSGKEYYYKIIPYTATENSVTHGSFSEVVIARVKNSVKRSLCTKKKYTLKAKASASASSVVTVPKNTVLTIHSQTLSKSGNTWYYVSYKNTKYYGYIPKTKGTLYRYGKVTSKILNVREGANTKKNLVTVLKRGKKVTILSKKTNKAGEVWYKIEVKKGKYTYIGFVFGEYLKLQ